MPGQHRGQAQQCLQCQSGQASGQLELILRLESYNDGPRFHNRVWDGQKVLFLPRDGNILPLYYRASSPQQALYYHIILLLHCNTVTLSHCISLPPDSWLASQQTQPTALIFHYFSWISNISQYRIYHFRIAPCLDRKKKRIKTSIK